MKRWNIYYIYLKLEGEWLIWLKPLHSTLLHSSWEVLSCLWKCALFHWCNLTNAGCDRLELYLPSWMCHRTRTGIEQGMASSFETLTDVPSFRKFPSEISISGYPHMCTYSCCTSALRPYFFILYTYIFFACEQDLGLKTRHISNFELPTTDTSWLVKVPLPIPAEANSEGYLEGTARANSRRTQGARVE